MLLMCDPTLLFKSGEEARRCKALVDDWENQMKNLPEGVSEQEMSRQLWEAQVCVCVFFMCCAIMCFVRTGYKM